MPVPLLATKLFLPPIRSERVLRPRLLERLNELVRPGAQLALISAPAGFGKTSLLTEWLGRREQPAAWLALDSGDNAPGLFLAYLVAALNRAQPGLVSETAALTGAQPAPPLEVVLSSLVNELSALDPSSPLIVALDDFQFINAEEVRQEVAFLIEHLPPGVRLVIATRSDPPLPLARLRARGQLLELRAADLRFSAEEAAEFLGRSARLRLEAQALPEIVQAITARTEGWAAGLQMAALALQSAPQIDSAEFIRTFTGSHRFVLDYLAEEVLARLPEETLTFLLRTALLERFCADLCAEMVGGTAGSNQLLLEQLDRSNLFLIPLDPERRWFRYHHLFADLLRARLRQAHPKVIPDLHRRAAGWFERSGLISEAIQHTLSAAAAANPETAQADYDRAARLVEQHTVGLLRRGELHGLEGWVSLLPAELADRRPWLCIYRAWVEVFSGRLAGIEPLLQQAEARGSERNQEEQRELEGHCAAIRTHLSLLAPGHGDTLALICQVREKIPEKDWARGVAEWSVGYFLREQGQLEQAADIFERQASQGAVKGDAWGEAMNFTDLGIVRRLQGRMHEALQVFQRGLQTVEAHGGRRLGYTGRLLTGMASVQYEQNDLAGAGRSIEEAIELNQRWRNPNHLVFAFLNQARVLAARGEYRRAGEALDAAGQVVRDLPVLKTLGESLAASRISIGLMQGQVPPPGGVLEEQIQAALTEEPPSTTYNELWEVRNSLLARVLLAQNRPGEALRLLERQTAASRPSGRMSALVEQLSLMALGWHAVGKNEAALEALAEAVQVAGAGGMVRSILDTAPLVPGVLSELLAALRRRMPAEREYLDLLLAALPGEAAAPTASHRGVDHATQPARNELVEPITGREMEVLRLLAEGLTNAQIAGRLVITTGTVKAHTAAIFRKLDALNRTQAVTRARELGLLV